MPTFSVVEGDEGKDKLEDQETPQMKVYGRHWQQ